MYKVKKTFLKNGIKVIIEEMPDAESLAVGVWIKNGSRQESPNERGISHFIEHLLFKGTKRRRSLDIAKDIEMVGGFLNAFTSREYTCFYAKVLNKDAPLAIELLSDIFLNSTFPPAELEKERLVVIQEIKLVDDTPDDLIHDLFSERLWSGHPLGAPILGRKETVRSLTRDAILKYFRRYYHSGDVFITLAGGVRHKNMIKLLKEAFKGKKSGIISSMGSWTPPEATRGVKLVKRNLEQVHFCMGVPALDQRHPDRYKLYLLNTILGGGMSSRLFQEIREKRGLAYSVYSYLNLFNDAGSLVIYAGTTKEDFKKVVHLAIKECEKLKNCVSREQLRIAKEQLKGGMVLSLDTTDARMTKLARDEMCFGRVVPVKEIVNAIDRVKAGDIKKLAARLFSTENMTMVAIGKVDGNKAHNNLLKKSICCVVASASALNILYQYASLEARPTLRVGAPRLASGWVPIASL